jgi:hypothetical protein
MAQLIRKQIYLKRRQQALLKKLAKSSGLTETELIRQWVEQRINSDTSLRRDKSAWERERAFIQSRMMLKAVATLRQWTRDEIYEERLSRHGAVRSG